MNVRFQVVKVAEANDVISEDMSPLLQVAFMLLHFVDNLGNLDLLLLLKIILCSNNVMLLKSAPRKKICGQMK